jgi:hypothetical protein
VFVHSIIKLIGINVKILMTVMLLSISSLATAAMFGGIAPNPYDSGAVSSAEAQKYKERAEEAERKQRESERGHERERERERGHEHNRNF